MLFFFQTASDDEEIVEKVAANEVCDVAALVKANETIQNYYKSKFDEKEKEVEDLKQQLAAVRYQVEKDLNIEKGAMVQQIEELVSANREFQAVNEQLNEQDVVYKRGLKFLRVKNKKLRKMNAALESEQDIAFKARLKKISALNKVQEAQMSHANEKMQKMRAKNRTLKQKIEQQAMTHEEELSYWKNRCTEISEQNKTQKSSFEKRIENLVSANLKLIDKHKAVKDGLNEMEKENHVLKEILSEKEDKDNALGWNKSIGKLMRLKDDKITNLVRKIGRLNAITGSYSDLVLREHNYTNPGMITQM